MVPVSRHRYSNMAIRAFVSLRHRGTGKHTCMLTRTLLRFEIYVWGFLSHCQVARRTSKKNFVLRRMPHVGMMHNRAALLRVGAARDCHLWDTTDHSMLEFANYSRIGGHIWN